MSDRRDAAIRWVANAECLHCHGAGLAEGCVCSCVRAEPAPKREAFTCYGCGETGQHRWPCAVGQEELSKTGCVLWIMPGTTEAHGTRGTMADRIDEIRARWAKATRGEWRPGGYGVETCEGLPIISPHYGWFDANPNTPDDVEAIAAAPTDVAYLLARIEILERHMGRDCMGTAWPELEALEGR
jgi:hypothetical protein